MFSSISLLADLEMNGWTITGIIVAALILSVFLFNLSDVIRYIRISRM